MSSVEEPKLTKKDFLPFCSIVLYRKGASFAFGQCVACPLMSWFNAHQITVISSFGRCSRYVRYGAPSVAV